MTRMMAIANKETNEDHLRERHSKDLSSDEQYLNYTLDQEFDHFRRGKFSRRLYLNYILDQGFLKEF